MWACTDLIYIAPVVSQTYLHLYSWFLLGRWPYIAPSTAPPNVTQSRGPLVRRSENILGGSARAWSPECTSSSTSVLVGTLIQFVTLETTDSWLSHQVVAEYDSPFLLHRRALHPLVLWERDISHSVMLTLFVCRCLVYWLGGIYVHSFLTMPLQPTNMVSAIFSGLVNVLSSVSNRT